MPVDSGEPAAPSQGKSMYSITTNDESETLPLEPRPSPCRSPGACTVLGRHWSLLPVVVLPAAAKSLRRHRTGVEGTHPSCGTVCPSSAAAAGSPTASVWSRSAWSWRTASGRKSVCASPPPSANGQRARAAATARHPACGLLAANARQNTPRRRGSTVRLDAVCGKQNAYQFISLPSWERSMQG